MGKVCNGIGKVTRGLLWGSNQVCTKPNRSFVFRTPLVTGVCDYPKSLICKWVGVSHGQERFRLMTLCSPLGPYIWVGVSHNFSLTFFRKAVND
jgi:hypothetical protein